MEDIIIALVLQALDAALTKAIETGFRAGDLHP